MMKKSVFLPFWVLALSLLTVLALVPPSASADQGGLTFVDEEMDVLIGFRRTPGLAEEGIVQAAGGRIKYTYRLVPAIAARVPQQALEGLRRNPNVTSIDPDGVIYAIDAELDNTWGVKRIGAGFAHDRSNFGTGVKVAVIDSGVDYTHPDLDANFAGGRDFVNGDNDPMDDNGHGTHVSGTVAAEDDGAGVVGAAPKARIYALKVLNAAGSGRWSDVIAALDWAVANGMQVTNNSYGSDSNPGGIVESAFNNSEAAGILHVAAAGNSGNPAGKGNNVGYPARYNSVIAVAATDQSDGRAPFSSTGDQVELAAPGVKVKSTKLGGGYVEFNGTSMASPHVAGTSALVIAAGITDSNGNGRINDEVRNRMNQTADDLGATGRDPWYGFGLVDANEASNLGPTNNPPSVTITSPADGATFSSGETITFTGSASDTEDGDLTASLSWTSSIDGAIGTGGSFSRTLSNGVHTITASVTDSGGTTGSKSITITVGAVPTLSVTVATDKPSYVHGEKAAITVTVTDGTNPVEGASVHVDLTTANGGKLAGDGTTNSSGKATFTYKVNSKRDGKGTYTVDATASKTGYTSGSGSTTFQVTA